MLALRRLAVAALVLCCTISFVAQAAAQPGAGTAQVGVASWHRGSGRTASGRRWASEELVAAHRSLPMGTTVRVVNLRNGKATCVQITDRGPYARGRIIDLSVAAARELGCLEAWTARVRLEVLQPPFDRIAIAAILATSVV